MIATYTGKLIDVLNFKITDVDVVDIAHHLSLINRFNGASAFPISVAQHSVYVSRLACCEEHALQGLFHDAAEAYIGDITKNFKQSDMMMGFRELEDSIFEEIAHYFGFQYEFQGCVKKADEIMLCFEASQGLDNSYDFGKLTPQERNRIGVWQPWGWQDAEARFLNEYKRLMK